MISSKYIPSKVAIDIINTVILAKLVYRLQVTSVPTTISDDIDVLSRKFLKRKAGLPASTNNFVLEDKQLGLGL
jgi:hypothetical protein